MDDGDDGLFTIILDGEPEKGEAIPLRFAPPGDVAAKVGAPDGQGRRESQAMPQAAPHPYRPIAVPAFHDRPSDVSSSPDRTPTGQASVGQAELTELDVTADYLGGRRIRPTGLPPAGAPSSGSSPSVAPPTDPAPSGAYAQRPAAAAGQAPPDLSRKGMLADMLSRRDPYLRQGEPTSKRFLELAALYKDRTSPDAAKVPFLSFYPSYEVMSESQLEWYFNLRARLRAGDYAEADLSYVFVYLYELINRVHGDDPYDGLRRMVGVWSAYRGTFPGIDRYLTDWVGDYLAYYGCDPGEAFALLREEGLFLLMGVDTLLDHYLKGGLPIPAELMARLSDYKFYESDFIKGEHGGLFLDNVSELLAKVRNLKGKAGKAPFDEVSTPQPPPFPIRRIPFQKAIFYNPEDRRLPAYPLYERHKPLRSFVTALAKGFENALRVLTKSKGRLRAVGLSDEIAALCASQAKEATAPGAAARRVEVTIDRVRLLALMRESDEVRERLIEGLRDYEDPLGGGLGAEPDPDRSGSESAGVMDAGAATGSGVDMAGGMDSGAGPEPGGAESAPIAPGGARHGDAGTAPSTGAVAGPSDLMSALTETQRLIYRHIAGKGGEAMESDLGASFPGVLVGAELDRINDAALGAVGDLALGYEGGKWYIIDA